MKPSTSKSERNLRSKSVSEPKSDPNSKLIMKPSTSKPEAKKPRYKSQPKPDPSSKLISQELIKIKTKEFAEFSKQVRRDGESQKQRILDNFNKLPDFDFTLQLPGVPKPGSTYIFKATNQTLLHPKGQPAGRHEVLGVDLDPTLDLPPTNRYQPTHRNIITEDRTTLCNLPYLDNDDDDSFHKNLATIYNAITPEAAQAALRHAQFNLTEDQMQSSLIPEVTRRFKASTRKELLPDQILERFIKVPKEPPAEPVVPNLDDDAQHTRVYSAQEALNSFRTLMCARPGCYMYDCQRHLDPLEPAVVSPREAIQRLQHTPEDIEYLTVREPCGPACFLNLDSVAPEDYLGPNQPANKDPKLKSARFDPDTWSNSDRTMLNVHALTFNQHYCRIANCLDKPCYQVYQMAEILALDHPEDHEKLPLQVKRPGKKNKIPKTRLAAESVPSANPIRWDPCCHAPLPCTDPKAKCTCRAAATFCQLQCSCGRACQHQFPGCRCKSDSKTRTCRTMKCPCHASHRECDPTLCHNCGADEYVGPIGCLKTGFVAEDPAAPFRIRCKNVGIQRGQRLKLGRAKSEVAGWGCFLMEPKGAEKWDFITEYCGEILSEEEADRRGFIYDKIEYNYLFRLTTSQVLDAFHIGNKSRFINHAQDPQAKSRAEVKKLVNEEEKEEEEPQPNCQAAVKLVNGDQRLGIYALRRIEPEEELLLNYQYEDKTFGKKKKEEEEAKNQKEAAKKSQKDPKKK